MEEVSTIFAEPQLADPELDEGEPLFAHYVAKDKIAQAYVEGTPVQALCGHVFVPTRDPERYPVCQKCVEVAKQNLAGKMGLN